MMRYARAVLGMVLVASATALLVAEKPKYSANISENFTFAGPFTYAWTSPTGELKMLQVAENDPDRWRRLWDGAIVGSVDRELAARGFTAGAKESADIIATYYILIGPNVASQKMGQFMAPTMEWGLPPFQGIAQSYDVAEQGSLVIDLYSQSRKFVVWRGMAQANIDLRRTDGERNKNIAKLITELFKRHYPKGDKKK
jgi:hypothetical protein